MVAGEARAPGARVLASLGLLALLLALTFTQRPALAGPPEPASEAASHGTAEVHERLRLIWRTASVAWPLVPLGDGEQLAVGLAQREAMLDGRELAPSVRGVVEIDRARAVGVWLDALETVRVRSLDGAVLRFFRVVDGHTAVLERGRAPASCPDQRGGGACWELHQPPSNGALWSIESDAPARILVERVEVRPPRYVAVEVEHDLLEWIADGGDDPSMPAVLEPSDVGVRLRYDAALARELVRVGGSDRRLQRAIEAWRMLGAMAAVDRDRPALRPYFVRDRTHPLALAGTPTTRLRTDDSRTYRLASGPNRWTVDRRGPGQLQIHARAWAPAGESLRGAELRIHAGGRVIERIVLSPRQARRAVDPDTVLPRFAPLWTEAGEPVGELAQRTIVLAPGNRDYEIELVGGGALLAIEGSRRIEATAATIRGWTPRKQARAAARALRRSDAASRPWLELLLAERTHAPLPFAAADPRLDELAHQSPLLASACLVIAGGAEVLDGDATARLVARAKPWLSALDRDPTIDPAVRGWLRAQWIELVARRGRPELAAVIVERDPKAGNDPIAELPVAGLRTLADLIAPTHVRQRSSALALLELARRRAPADEELRGQVLRLWTEASRWSRSQPLPRGARTRFDIDSSFAPVGEWLIARDPEHAPDEPTEVGDSYVRLEPGQPAQIHAELRDDSITAAGRRKRLFDVYVATPLDAREPASLRVDERRWWSPQLEPVQRHRVALGPGAHEIALDGPPGTIAWIGALSVAERVSAAAERLGRRERMWPLARSVWKLPGPAVPGFVRLELRWPDGVPPRSVRIRVIEGGDARREQVVLFDPRAADLAPELEIDRAALPILGSPWASARHDVTLAIAASTTELRFEVEGEVEIAASLSLRRSVQPSDLATGSPSPASDDVVVLLEPLTGLDRTGLLRELELASRELLEHPDALELRARRAAIALLLGETGHARAELVRLAAFAERDSVPEPRRERALALLEALEQRFEALTDPREIVVADPGRVATPELVEPAIAAFVADDRGAIEPWLDAWSTIRTGDLDAALERIDAEIARLRAARATLRSAVDLAQIDRRLQLGAMARAQLLARDPSRAREAAREWIGIYGRLPGELARAREPVGVGLASVGPLLTHLDDPSSDARDAGIAYGLARELEPIYGHASVRRLAFVAALRSDWTRLDHSHDNAGYERLELPVAELQQSPAAAVREALLVAPWPRGESEQLRPGRKGVLAWDAEPGSASVQLWCRAARPDLAPSLAAVADRASELGTAKLTIRLHGPKRRAPPIEREVELADAELGEIELPIDRRGRHHLEVELADDPIWLCAWRTTARVAQGSDDAVIEARRRARWWTASSSRGVELIVLGPASLHVELRGVAHRDPERSATAVLATVERLDFDHQIPPEYPRVSHGRLPLAVAREPAVITESRRRFEVSDSSSHTLLLTEPGPHRVRLEADRGRALVRARLRSDRRDSPPPARISIYELRPEPPDPVAELDWRGGGPSSAILARDAIVPVRNRVGTLELRVHAGLDQLGDVDDLRPRPGLVASVGWRRALVEHSLWLGIAAETRLREQSTPAGGGALRLAARLPPIGVRLGAELDVLAQAFDGLTATSVRLYGFVDRPTWLGAHVQLRPGLTAGLRWQSLDAERVAAATTELEPHPRVYLRYLETHPVLLQPELELRIYPLQDMAVWTEAQLVPNSDIRSLDHVNVEIGTAGIARRPRPWVPTWGLSYQASPRFADRDRSAFFVRHRVETQLGVAVWARDTARVAFGVTNQLYLSSVAPLRNVIELWLRVDATFGRRMRDYGPREQWFREPWAPRAWGDDEHQARSTYAPSQR